MERQQLLNCKVNKIPVFLNGIKEVLIKDIVDNLVMLEDGSNVSFGELYPKQIFKKIKTV